MREKTVAKVVECYITSNGMVLSCDASGQQVTECQGFVFDIGEKLKEHCDENTVWYFGKRNQWLEQVDFSWWWLEKRGKSTRKRWRCLTRILTGWLKYLAVLLRQNKRHMLGGT